MMCVISVCDNYDRMTVGEWMSCSWGQEVLFLFLLSSLYRSKIFPEHARGRDKFLALPSTFTLGGCSN